MYSHAPCRACRSVGVRTHGDSCPAVPLHLYMHTCTHTDVYAHTQCIHIQTCICAHKYMHTGAHAHIHTCTHVCIRIHAHVHIPRLPHGQSCSSSPLAPTTTLPCADSRCYPQVHGPSQSPLRGNPPSSTQNHSAGLPFPPRPRRQAPPRAQPAPGLA